MKAVNVICPKCNGVMTFKNWFSWIWNTPFHWFGKRRTVCAYCGVTNWIKRVK